MDDPDGLDARQRAEVALRLTALSAQGDRDALVASLTGLELAQHDLAAMLEFRREYEAGTTVFPINESNTAGINRLIEELRRQIESFRG